MKTCFYVLAALALFAGSAAADWNAGLDLKANELPDGNVNESIDPNPTVPEWSYGYRGILNSTALTLFTTGQHTNTFNGSSDAQGFSLANGNDNAVNVGTSDVIFNNGSGPLLPLHPGEIILHPGPTPGVNAFEVVRWIAPATATYSLTAFWSDLDTHGGDGAEGAVILNGASLFDVAFGNGGGTSTNFNHFFSAGDIVDFVVGPQGSYNADSTAFNATITSIPEPGGTAASLCLLASGVILAHYRSRQKSRSAT